MCTRDVQETPHQHLWLPARPLSRSSNHTDKQTHAAGRILHLVRNRANPHLPTPWPQVSTKYTDEHARLRVLQGGQVKEVKVGLRAGVRLVPFHTRGLPPSYFIVAGLVFTTVTVPYLKSEWVLGTGGWGGATQNARIPCKASEEHGGGGGGGEGAGGRGRGLKEGRRRGPEDGRGEDCCAGCVRRVISM